MVSDSKVRKIIERASTQARRNEPPRPKILAWCVREVLYALYGHRSNY